MVVGEDVRSDHLRARRSGQACGPLQPAPRPVGAVDTDDETTHEGGHGTRPDLTTRSNATAREQGAAAGITAVGHDAPSTTTRAAEVEKRARRTPLRGEPTTTRSASSAAVRSAAAG